MNIWIEGVDGTGKTTLAKALGEALGVKPLYNVAHNELTEGQELNVIDRHAVISNRVYKEALPERFKNAPLRKGALEYGCLDFFILLRREPVRIESWEEYTHRELNKLTLAYDKFFHKNPVNLITITQDDSTIRISDELSDPTFTRTITLALRGAHRSAEVALKVREILKIIMEASKTRVANQ